MAMMDSTQGSDKRRCVCGRAVEAPVVVHWKNGDRTYWYCADCAADVLALEGTDIDMDTEGWAADQTPDEWDATVASATIGSADDYSHLDDED